MVKNLIWFVGTGLALVWCYYLWQLVRLVLEGRLAWDTALLGCLAHVGAAGAATFGVLHFWWMIHISFTERDLGINNNNRIALQSLVAEIGEYRKMHPTIDPILQSFNLLPIKNAGTNAAPAPAATSTRPAAK